MMKRLEGRNLRHPGCLVGMTSGLTLGIILAGILAVNNVPLNTVLLIWLGLTVLLGAFGWFIGARMTGRAPSTKESAPTSDS
ncbi:MAG TPA: hypothetical protein VKT25_00400 [Ktedonobacteraceae bacterium]|nr:hypothetical protein [Ktedonobacteraceae bacterium]